MPRKTSPSPRVIYIVRSWILDWEAGEWPSETPSVTRFAVRGDAIAAFRKNQTILDAQAQAGAAQVREGVKHGYRTAMGGFTVINLVFGVPSERLRRVEKAPDDEDREDALSELVDDLSQYVLHDGCYDFNYRSDRAYGVDDVLGTLDPGFLLDQGGNPTGPK